MDNPYEAPVPAAGSTPPAAARTWVSVLVTVLSVLIAVVCALMFLGVWISIVQYIVHDHYGPLDDPLRYLGLAILALEPFVLALGGILLAFRRAFCVPLFAIYVVQYVMRYGTHEAFNPVHVGMIMAFLGFAAWRWKSGQLKGWPSRRR